MSPIYVGAANSSNKILGNLSSDPGTGVDGDLYYNTSTKRYKFYNGSTWADVNAEILTATGGTVTTSGAYKIHTFTTNGNFTVSSGSKSIDYLIVGGGGSTGNSWTSGGGGGGGGASNGTSGTA